MPRLITLSGYIESMETGAIQLICIPEDLDLSSFPNPPISEFNRGFTLVKISTRGNIVKHFSRDLMIYLKTSGKDIKSAKLDVTVSAVKYSFQSSISGKIVTGTKFNLKTIDVKNV